MAINKWSKWTHYIGNHSTRVPLKHSKICSSRCDCFPSLVSFNVSGQTNRLCRLWLVQHMSDNTTVFAGNIVRLHCLSHHHSPHLHSHHLSVPWLFTPNLKLTCFTNPFPQSFWFYWTACILDLDWTKWALAFCCFSFFFLYFCFWLRVQDQADQWPRSAFQSK